MKSSRSNAPSTDKRSCEFVFVNESLEVVGISLGVIILSLERLTALPLSARVIPDLMKGDRRINDRETNCVTRTDEVKVLEEFGIFELFLKRQSGARETGDKDDRWFGGITGRMGPDLSTVLGLHELSERGHDEDIQALSTDGLIGRRTEGGERYVGVMFTAEGIL